MFRNFILTAWLGKNNYLYYTISKRWYCKEGEVKQKLTLSNNEVGELLNNFRKMIINPKIANEKFNKEKCEKEDPQKKQ